MIGAGDAARRHLHSSALRFFTFWLSTAPLDVNCTVRAMHHQTATVWQTALAQCSEPCPEMRRSSAAEARSAGAVERRAPQMPQRSSGRCCSQASAADAAAKQRHALQVLHTGERRSAAAARAAGAAEKADAAATQRRALWVLQKGERRRCRSAAEARAAPSVSECMCVVRWSGTYSCWFLIKSVRCKRDASLLC